MTFQPSKVCINNVELKILENFLLFLKLQSLTESDYKFYYDLT